ncbi:MAG: hypothetical protein EXR72_00270 [Myxococcales bacterium]|nr:hypothetical protein [Myxococcales bacterium]
MKSALMTGFLSMGVALTGCGQVGSEGVGSIEEELPVPVLWKCNATCTGGKTKVKYISCSTNNVVAVNDAPGQCKLAYGNGSTVVRVNCSMVKPLTQCKLPSCGGNGDPHMFTFDGLRYEYQPAGEFVLATDNATYAIQARMQQWGGSRASVQTALSVDVGNVKVGIYAREQPTLRINGQPGVLPCADAPLANGALCSGRMDFENGGYLTFDQNSKKFSVYLTDEVSHLDVWLNKDYVNSQFFAGPEIQLNTVGLGGSINGNPADDITTRDGEIMVQPVKFADFYGNYANSWRIDNAESLFDYAHGKSTANYVDLKFPAATMSAKDLPPADHDAAVAACKAAGVPDGQLEECALDAALMGPEAALDFLHFGKF